MKLELLKKRIADLDDRKSRQFVTLLRRAAALGDVESMTKFAMYLRDGLQDRNGKTVLARDGKTSARWYRKAAELGDPSAMNAYATLLPQRRSAEAIGWYLRAIRSGDLVAGFNLAVTYQNLARHKEAVAWFRKVAAAGEIDALLPLAKAELQGLGTRRNVSAALEKLRRVAEATGVVTQFDQEEAMRTLAQAYYDGWLVRRDWAKSVRWLRRAADLGSSAARGLLRDHGEPLPKEPRQAFEWALSAAESGDPYAAGDLALMYEKGWGCRKDARQAFAWMKRAAEGDHVRAQHDLAWYFANGKGVRADVKKALAWYRRAAARGYASSAFNIALLHRRRRPVEAKKWLRRAAALGHITASRYLRTGDEGLLDT
jgi:TPR repeat protein